MVMLQGWRYHVVGGDKLIEKMMEEACAVRTGLGTADIVIFSGGTDINPRLYHQTKLDKTQNPDLDRDRIEQAVYHAAVAKKKYIVGICRGAQLVNVLNGGSLWQHVDGHVGTNHQMMYINEDGGKFIVAVTSDHHQLVIPTADGKIWGYAQECTFKQNDVIKRHVAPNQANPEPEIVFYKATRSLCFQPHPEWGLASCRELFYDCVRRAMMGG